MKEVTEKEIKFYNEHKDVIQPLEHAMVIKRYKIPTHPQQRINDVESNIKAYSTLKAFCYKSKIGKLYFDNMHRHCITNKSNDTDWLEILCDELNRIKKNYDKLLAKYEKDLVSYENTNRNNIDLPKHFENIFDVRVNERTTIYTNETNTYISPLGLKCIEFEESIIENATLYKNNSCPYCNNEVEMPKMKKTCPHCKQKIYVRQGGIGQGNIVMKEEQYNMLKKLKDDFYNDRNFNPNYGHGIVVEDITNKIERK